MQRLPHPPNPSPTPNPTPIPNPNPTPNPKQERLLESLLSSPGCHPDLLNTPNLSKLTTQLAPSLAPRCAAAGWSASR